MHPGLRSSQLVYKGSMPDDLARVSCESSVKVHRREDPACWLPEQCDKDNTSCSGRAEASHFGESASTVGGKTLMVHVARLKVRRENGFERGGSHFVKAQGDDRGIWLYAEWHGHCCTRERADSVNGDYDKCCERAEGADRATG